MSGSQASFFSGLPKAPTFRKLSALSSPNVLGLVHYWERMRKLNELPRFEDVDFAALGFILDKLNVIELVGSPPDFRFLVHSPSGAAYIGRDLTGRFVTDYPDEQYRRYVRACFERAVRTGAATVVVERTFVTSDRILRWEGAILPTGDQAGAVTHLLVGFELLH